VRSKTDAMASLIYRARHRSDK